MTQRSPRARIWETRSEISTVLPEPVVPETMVVLGLGALRIRDARNAVGSEPPAARQLRERAVMRRLDPPAQLPGGDHFRSADALLASELRAPEPERDQEQPDQPAARQRAEPGTGERLTLDPLPGLSGREGGGDVANAERAPRAVLEPHLLAGIGIVAEDQLGLGQSHHAGGVPLRPGGALPERPGRHRNRGEGGEQHGRPEQLAPHADRVEDGLTAPQRAAADTAHDVLPVLAFSASWRWRRAGAGRSGTGRREPPGDTIGGHDHDAHIAWPGP